MIVGNLVAKFGLDASGFKTGMKQVEKQVSTTNRKVKKLTGSMGPLVFKIGAVGAVAAATAMKMGQMIAKMESIDRTLEASVGNAEDVERAWNFLRSTSDRLGIGLEGLAAQYGTLTAAAMGSALVTEQIETIFTAISEKAAILGMSNMRVRLTFLAIEQMISKTVISMEELRRQFGENVPGALGIMSRALGISTKELNEWVTSGKLLAEDVLPLMADQMLRENAPAIEMLSSTMQRSLAGINTAWFDLKRAVADGVIKDSLMAIFKVFEIGTNILTGTLKAINAVWFAFKGATSTAMEWAAITGDMSLGMFSDENIKKIEDNANKGLLTEKEIAAKRLEIYKKINGAAEKELEAWNKTVVGVLDSTLGEFTSFISDLATGADVSFGDMLKGMAKKLLDFTTTMLVVKPILDWFSGWLEGVGGGSGGAAGFMLKAFNFPVKAMANGGMINEPVFGIGAKSGGGYLLGENGPEEVIPSGSGRGANVNITINALDSKSVTELLKNNPQAVTGPIVEAVTSGDRGLSSSLRLAVN